MIDPNILIFALGLILVIIEIILGVDTAFDLVVIGSALLVGSTTGYFTDSFLITVGVSTALSFIYVFIGRRYLRKKLETQIKATNIDSVIGEKTTLKSWDMKRKVGRVTIKGEDWRVTSQTRLKLNDQVVVESVDGVTLVIAKSDN